MDYTEYVLTQARQWAMAASPRAVYTVDSSPCKEGHDTVSELRRAAGRLFGQCQSTRHTVA